MHKDVEIFIIIYIYIYIYVYIHVMPRNARNTDSGNLKQAADVFLLIMFLVVRHSQVSWHTGSRHLIFGRPDDTLQTKPIHFMYIII